MSVAKKAGHRKRTGGIRGQHGDDVVCTGGALFGRRSHVTSGGCQFSQGVGADDVITRHEEDVGGITHARQADLKSNPRTVKPPFTRLAAIGPPLTAKSVSAREAARAGKALLHVSEADEADAPAHTALHAVT
jgi:hypothetical protein